MGRLSDPEVRFAKTTKWGKPPDYKPELGPCLIFTGADNGNGYGQFCYDGKGGYIHRYAWERERGPIPQGLTVDHLCRVRRCANVDHMELVDGPENTRRGARARPRKTHCKRGHEYAVVGQRENYCQQCARDKGLARWLRERKSPPGTDVRVVYDQALVREVVYEVRMAKMTIAQGARRIGCNPNYLGRRIWKETRKAVLARDEDICVRCCASGPLDVHHRINRGSGGAAPDISFGMANLISLCRLCHSWVTDHTVLAREQGGWCLTRADDPGTVPVLWRGTDWVLLTSDGGMVPAEDSAA